jgi:hypothetical protein
MFLPLDLALYKAASARANTVSSLSSRLSVAIPQDSVSCTDLSSVFLNLDIWSVVNRKDRKKKWNENGEM